MKDHKGVSYRDSQGNLTTLDLLVREEPEWAANHIRKLDMELLLEQESNAVVSDDRDKRIRELEGLLDKAMCHAALVRSTTIGCSTCKVWRESQKRIRELEEELAETKQLYKAGCEQWNPVYKTALDRIRELEEVLEHCVEQMQLCFDNFRAMDRFKTKDEWPALKAARKVLERKK